MVTYRDLVSGLESFHINACQPVIVHASLSAFGDIRGGAETVVGAVLANFRSMMMPAFTYKTMLIPETGPGTNAIEYGSGKDANKLAEFYSKDLPVDRTIGVVAETFRKHPSAHRSDHPILSFCGIGVDEALQAQTFSDPFAPMRKLLEQLGWVLLMGVDNSVNTSIHYVEKLVGRRQFIRWALTPDGVVECPGFPGCSLGFEAISPYLDSLTRRVQIGPTVVRAIPLDGLVEIICLVLKQDPLALLCDTADCKCCQAVRLSI